MERREFIGVVGQVLAGALGTPLLGACATIGGPSLEAMGERDVGPFLATVRAHTKRLRGTAPHPAMRRFVAERGHRPDLVEENAAALFVSSSFRDLPRQLQEHHEVQAWIAEEAPRLSRAVLSMASFLDELSEEERRVLGEALREDPSLYTDLASATAASSRARGLPESRATQAKQVMGHVGFRLAKQSPSAVIDEYLSKVARISRREGLEDWRAWEAALQSEPPPDSTPGPGESRRGMHVVTRVGLVILGIGAGIGILGLVLFGMGAAAETGLTILGALLVVAGLAIMAVGGLIALIGVAVHAGEPPLSTVEVPAGRLTTVFEAPTTYPRAARERGLGEITCPVDVVIDPQGVPVAARVDARCPVELRTATTGTIRQWRWAPYQVDGEAVQVRTRVELRFVP